MPTCLSASAVYMPTCLHANTPKAYQLLIFICQHSNKHANIPSGIPMFQLDVSTCQKHANFSKIYFKHAHIIYIYVLYIKILLHFISKLHVTLKKRVCNFSFLIFFLFYSFENIKRSGFYILQITTVLWNFYQLKELNKIKNTCDYCDLLEWWSAWVGNPR